MDRTNIAFVGLGGRGSGLADLVAQMEDVRIPAVCDVYQDRVDRKVERLEELTGHRPEGYLDYREMLARGDLQGVVIASSWTTHVEISLAAMRAGVYAAAEVGGASSIQECWELVRVSEETGVPFMLLENCCYGREEMAVLNMVKQDLFGELIHCQCGYEHDLRSEITRGTENRHYRLNNFTYRNGDLYPTHGVGPIAKMLNINKGNRFTSLVSMTTKSRGLHEYAVKELGPEHSQYDTVFGQGDVTTTMVKCARGETVLLTHDCSLPRPYSRAQRVQGTKGLWGTATWADSINVYSETKQPDACFKISAEIGGVEASKWTSLATGMTPGACPAAWTDPEVAAKYPLYGWEGQWFSGNDPEAAAMPYNYRFNEMNAVFGAEWFPCKQGERDFNRAEIEKMNVKFNEVLAEPRP